MDLAQYRRINNIIERDSADATYKYALLRGVIEICQQFSHLREEDGDQVSFPLGLLVEKWLLYYYPIFAAPTFIPQKNGETQDLDAGKTISFRKHFAPVIDYYRDRGGISVFYSDYIRGSVPEEIGPAFRILVKEIRNTIVRMPMKHLGYSQSKEHYSVFDYDRPLYRLSSDSPVDRSHLIENFGRFFLSRDLCTVFEYFGSFISGEECLLKKWAAFTASADKTGTVTEECMLSCSPGPRRPNGRLRMHGISTGRSSRKGVARLCLVREGHSLTGRDAHRPCPPVLGLEEQRPLEPPPAPIPSMPRNATASPIRRSSSPERNTSSATGASSTTTSPARLSGRSRSRFLGCRRRGATGRTGRSSTSPKNALT